ncbi:hypothetical protein Tco_0125300, partial [Tanacetum coccineum]
METVGFGAYWTESARQILDKGNLRDYWIAISSAREFLGTAPSYTSIRDLILRPCHRLIACNIAGRRRKLTVIVRDLPIIDMAELVRLQIYEEIDDTWAWVAPGPERQPDATAGAHGAAEDAPAIDEGAQADLPLMHAPQPPPTPDKTMPQRVGRLEDEIQGLRQDVESLRGLV